MLQSTTSLALFFSLSLLLGHSALAKEENPLAEDLDYIGLAHGEDTNYYSIERLHELCPAKDITTLTTWTPETTFSGPEMSCILELIDVSDQENIYCTAWDDYTVEIPVSIIAQYDPILAHRKNGKPMAIHDSGPFWVIFPRSETEDMGDSLDDYFIWSVRRCGV